MPKKIKEVSVNKTDKYFTPSAPVVITLGQGEDAFDVTIKKRLSLEESISFVSALVYGMLDDDTVTYSIQEYLIRVTTLEYFTNIRLPQDIDKKYALVFDSDIIDRVMMEIDIELYNDLLTAYERQLAFEVAKIHSTFRTETQEFISKIESEAEQVMKIVQTFTNIFLDIEPEKMGKILAKIPEMESITEIGLAKAVLDIQKEGEENAGI